LVDELPYQAPTKSAETDKKSGEYAFVKIRYKLPDGDTSTLITTPVDAEHEYKALDAVPVDARFAAKCGSVWAIIERRSVFEKI
jgi:Ca-activated chloride channel family protein